MFEDEETRKIMRALARIEALHVRGLMDATTLPQNPLYMRLDRLAKARLIKERRVGKHRMFSLTKKGYRATYEDGTQQGREFMEFLKESAYGKQLLETMTSLERELIRFYLHHEGKRLDAIEHRLDYLANSEYEIELLTYQIAKEIGEAVRGARNTYEMISRDSEKIPPHQTLLHLHQFGEEVIGYIRSLGLTVGIELVFGEEKDSPWLNAPDYLTADAKKGLQEDRARALAVMQAIKDSSPPPRYLEHIGKGRTDEP